MLLDADEEEAQLIGYVWLPPGAGSKTFGTSGSKIDWNSGASITFAAGSTLRVGVKKASSISTTAGPPGRATVGAAAFDVYKDLVGGTDTISNTTAQTTTMDTGTPFTVVHGDIIAICFHLDVASGTPSVKVRQSNPFATSGFNTDYGTLVTSGGTVFSAQAIRPNAVITFDDGTLGCLTGSLISTPAGGATETIGNTNIYGNIFRPTVPITVSAIAALLTSAGTVAYDLGLWLASDPSTPIVSVSLDPQRDIAGSRRVASVSIATQSLTAGTDYVVGIKQNSATGIDIVQFDVNSTTFWPLMGLDANCYAVKSTAGGAFTSQNSNKRRTSFWFQATQFSDGAGGSGGGGSIPIIGGGIVQP